MTIEATLTSIMKHCKHQNAKTVRRLHTGFDFIRGNQLDFESQFGVKKGDCKKGNLLSNLSVETDCEEKQNKKKVKRYSITNSLKSIKTFSKRMKKSTINSRKFDPCHQDEESFKPGNNSHHPTTPTGLLLDLPLILENFFRHY